METTKQEQASIKNIDKKIQTLNELFREFGINPNGTMNYPKIIGLINETDIKDKIADTSTLEQIMRKLETVLAAIHKSLGGVNLDEPSPEIKSLTQSNQTFYTTLNDLNKTLNTVIRSTTKPTEKKRKEIEQILLIIPLAKKSILTAPQIDNPIRHGFVTEIFYEYLLTKYESTNTIQNDAASVKRIKIQTPVPQYIHSVFSEDFFVGIEKNTKYVTIWCHLRLT